MFQVIPAIDLIDGRCVRLTEGRYDTKKVFSDDPVAVARKFEEMGAPRLHIVDLDAAKSGQGANRKIVAEIAEALRIPVELGGGIRTMEDIRQVLDLGVQYAILGTVAVKNPMLVEEAADRWDKQILVGLDARDGLVATDGWTETSTVPAEKIVFRFEKSGIGGIIYTDISRDGRLTGPNLRAVADLAGRTTLPIIASGGVSTIRDLVALSRLEKSNLIGAIVGKALYEGRFQLDAAIESVRLNEQNA
jgi:phosphoribosylformimino-5-aminoimidazole carboxamide ribotide isomerase